MYIFKLKFYLKGRSAVYFFKTVLNKALLIFAFTVYLADFFFTLIKNNFLYVQCFSQVTAKRTMNKLQVKKNIMRKDTK